MIQCFNQQRITRLRDRITGLSTVKYEVISTKEVRMMTIRCNF